MRQVPFALRTLAHHYTNILLRDDAEASRKADAKEYFSDKNALGGVPTVSAAKSDDDAKLAARGGGGAKKRRYPLLKLPIPDLLVPPCQLGEDPPAAKRSRLGRDAHCGCVNVGDDEESREWQRQLLDWYALSSESSSSEASMGRLLRHLRLGSVSRPALRASAHLAAWAHLVASDGFDDRTAYLTAERCALSRCLRFPVALTCLVLSVHSFCFIGH